jgi:prophage maintenance system killer protein/predicted fused transcriptional regulator/phosphomethylpyrimidine kinase
MSENRNGKPYAKESIKETPANSDVVIYQGDDGVELQVRLVGETVWLNRHQLAELFGRDVKTVGKHINNALKEELANFSVVAKFAITATDGKVYQVEHYNLDMVLSVGYRVKSAEGIQFRRWASDTLKKYALEGYAVNQKRLDQLNKLLEIVSRSENSVVAGVADVLQNYAHGLDLLDEYDHQSFVAPKGKKGKWILTYDEARAFVDSMKFGNTSALFGNERDNSFKSTLGAIYQTFGGNDLYPSVQEKAANLLYMAVKNHSFTDGNKRIAAALFVYFLDKNDVLKGVSGLNVISNNTLAAITLVIALSKPEEKELMVLLVRNILDEKGEK